MLVILPPKDGLTDTRPRGYSVVTQVRPEVSQALAPLTGLAEGASQDGDLYRLIRSEDGFEAFIDEVIRDQRGRKLKLQPVHHRIIAALKEKRKLVVNVFRGGGKSTLITVAYVAWRIGCNRDIRVIIACKNESLAKEMMDSVVQIMARESYIKIFGNLIPAPRTQRWNDTEKVVSGRSEFATGLTLFAIGTGGAVAGRRADLVVADDVVDAENSATVIQRGHLSTWFFTELEPTVEPEGQGEEGEEPVEDTSLGQMCVVGTRRHFKDLYAELRETWSKRHKDEFSYLLLPVLYKDEKDEWQSAWPERFSVPFLLAWREAKPLEFAEQMQNDPVDTTLAFLQLAWLNENLIDTHEIPGYDPLQPLLPATKFLVYFGVDPSWSNSATADFAVICIGLKDPDKNIVYVVDMIRERADPDRLWEMVSMHARRWQPTLINMEANAAQSFLVKKQQEKTFFNINPVITSGGKTQRFVHMSTYFTMHRVRLAATKQDDGLLVPVSYLDPLFYEWSTFRGDRTTDHDDCLDALDFMLKAAAYGASPIDMVYDPSEGAWLMEKEGEDGTGKEIYLAPAVQGPACALCGATEDNLYRRGEGTVCGACSRRQLIDVRGRDFERIRRHFLVG